jgi:hypothetical protein
MVRFKPCEVVSPAGENHECDIDTWRESDRLFAHIPSECVFNTRILTSCQRADVVIKIVTLMTASSPPDRIERIASPGPAVSARPVAASENTLVSDLWRPTAVVLNDNRTLFRDRFLRRDCRTSSNVRRVMQCLSRSGWLCKDD